MNIGVSDETCLYNAAAPRYKPIGLAAYDKKLTQRIIHLFSNGCDTFILHINTTNIKVKQSRYRPGVAQRVPGS